MTMKKNITRKGHSLSLELAIGTTWSDPWVSLSLMEKDTAGRCTGTMYSLNLTTCIDFGYEEHKYDGTHHIFSVGPLHFYWY